MSPAFVILCCFYCVALLYFLYYAHQWTKRTSEWHNRRCHEIL